MGPNSSGRALAARLRAGLLILWLGLLLVPAAASAKPGPCHPGVFAYGSGEVRTFCGKAAADVHLKGKHFKLSGGTCVKTKDYFTINIGAVLLVAGGKPAPRYFGITVGKTSLFGGTPAGHDGTYTPLAIAINTGGNGYSVIKAKVTLKANRSKGSFTGTLFSGGAAYGTFRCS